MKNKRLEIIRSVMLGAAVADALGVPVEFLPREVLRADPVTDMRAYGTHNMPLGTFSDDTSMSLAALDAIKTGELDYLGVMNNFADWFYNGKYTSTGVCFDIGGSCLNAIRGFEKSGRRMPFGNADSDEFSCGNGALMRIHPFSLYAYFTEEDILKRLEIIHDAASLTHAHGRCLVGSGIFSFILWELFEKREKAAVAIGAKRAFMLYSDVPTRCAALFEELKYYQRAVYELADAAGACKISEEEIRSTGYVVDSLEAAIWCLMTTNDYKSAVLRAVNLGSDTDTVAAVTGALAGALYGEASIPSSWTERLLGREMIERMCECFAESVSK